MEHKGANQTQSGSFPPISVDLPGQSVGPGALRWLGALRTHPSLQLLERLQENPGTMKLSPPIAQIDMALDYLERGAGQNQQ